MKISGRAKALDVTGQLHAPATLPSWGKSPFLYHYFFTAVDDIASQQIFELFSDSSIDLCYHLTGTNCSEWDIRKFSWTVS